MIRDSTSRTIRGWIEQFLATERGDMAARTATNKLLCDIMIAPDRGVVVIEDAGAQGITGIYIQSGIDPEPAPVQQALRVQTMSADECDAVGRQLRVRVLSGSDTGGLGVRAFDGHLNIASGLLAIGDRSNPDRQLLVGPSGVIGVSVFVGNDIDAPCCDASGIGYPPSGPSEVTLLLHGDSWHTYTVRNTVDRWQLRC
ncbi:hypothetical protein SBE55_02550 [Mycolicibacterium sp. 141076]|uniref:hypothetical protein n=1 Tax=Mycolicibacterium sp. 141076 TaxID=3090599 RepID=UPI00299D1EF5|nr:hypothetical protein [Mycolicibacterium sp. 141076]MDX1876692.1 hypothetical protein [Mycolicibacterium sp. 141076]